MTPDMKVMLQIIKDIKKSSPTKGISTKLAVIYRVLFDMYKDWQENKKRFDNIEKEIEIEKDEKLDFAKWLDKEQEDATS